MFQVPTRQIFLWYCIYFIICNALKQADMWCICDTLYYDTNHSSNMHEHTAVVAHTYTQ